MSAVDFLVRNAGVGLHTDAIWTETVFHVSCSKTSSPFIALSLLAVRRRVVRYLSTNVVFVYIDYRQRGVSKMARTILFTPFQCLLWKWRPRRTVTHRGGRGKWSMYDQIRKCYPPVEGVVFLVSVVLALEWHVSVKISLRSSLTVQM